MATSKPSLLTHLDLPLLGTASVAALGLASGLGALTRPAAYATTFGLPHSTHTTTAGAAAPAANAFIPCVGARNLSGAATLLSFCYLRDRRALGVTLVCGLVTGLTDAVVCYRVGLRDGAYGHGGMSALLAALGLYLLVKG